MKKVVIAFSLLLSFFLVSLPSSTQAAAKVFIKSATFNDGTFALETTYTIDKKDVDAYPTIYLDIQLKDAASTVSPLRAQPVLTTTEKTNATSPKLGGHRFTTTNQNFAQSVDPKVVVNVKLMGRKNTVQNPVMLGEIGATIDNNKRTLPPLKAYHSFSEKDGQFTNTVSWDKVNEATLYTITRITGAGEEKTINAPSLAQLSLDVSNEYEGLEATSTFVVRAYKNNTLIAQGTTAARDVVQAQTEFGNIANIGQYAQKVMKYALPVGIAVGVIMAIWAGISLMLSQGSPDKIKSSQEALQGVVVGLAVLILARLMVDFLFIPSIDTDPNQPDIFNQFSQSTHQQRELL